MKWMILMLLVMGATSCAIDEDEATERWDAFVETHNACQMDSDCAMVYPGCPLGCGTAVSSEFEELAIERAAEIIGDYERRGQSCDYSCVPFGPPTCVDQRCEASPEF